MNTVPLTSSSVINIQAGLNYDVPQRDVGPGTVYQCVDENAVRLDLDDLGGEIVRVVLWSYIIVVSMLCANLLTCNSLRSSVSA